MKIYKKDGSEIELAEKEYADTRCVFKILDIRNTGIYVLNELENAKCILFEFKNNDNKSDTMAFPTSAYQSSLEGNVMTVSYVNQSIKIDYFAPNWFLYSAVIFY